MSQPIVFYDIPSNDTPPKAWSPNTWKIRFALNIKGIPYKTVWVEYPDIAAVIQKIGALPTDTNDDGTPYYTLPAIYDPNTRTALSDSPKIVRYLERTYPDTYRLIPPGTDALHAAFGPAYGRPLAPLRYLVIPATVLRLPPRSAAFFRETREADPDFGRPLEEVAPPGPVRDEHWAGVRAAFELYRGWLLADGVDKLFFLGDRIGYADVTIASVLMWIRNTIGEDSKEWEDLKTWDGGRWVRFLDAFKEYETVDVGEAAVI